MIEADVQAINGDWIRSVRFLVDTGADRTVLSADVWELLRLPEVEDPVGIHGLGGAIESISIQTNIRFLKHDGLTATVSGTFAAATVREILDMSILGRDLMDMCSVLIDRPGDRVVLCNQHHRCTVEEKSPAQGEG